MATQLQVNLCTAGRAASKMQNGFPNWNLKIHSTYLAHVAKSVTVHLLDQAGAVIESLVTPLVRRSDRHVVMTGYEGPKQFSVEKLWKLIEIHDQVAVVLHSSGRNTAFFQNLSSLAPLVDKLAILMHVNPEYFVMNDRPWVIPSLKKMQAESNLIVLTPGHTTAALYDALGVHATAIQFGVGILGGAPVNLVDTRRDVIVTSCTNDTDKYRIAKGIDRFGELAARLDGSVTPLVAGFDGSYRGVEAKAFGSEEFENLLATRVLAYVQLSRTEAYNLTAVRAKRLGVPVVVWDSEGHIDNVLHGYRVDSVGQAVEVVNGLSTGSLDSSAVVAANLRDSLRRESLATYEASLSGALELATSPERQHPSWQTI